MRDLGPFLPKRPSKLNAPIIEMQFNGLHDRHGGDVFVLQVGAGTGQPGLPLLPRFDTAGWSGLLIEPHPQHFAALETLYAKSDRVAVLNLGISDIAANLPLYSLTPEALARLPRLPRGRASLMADRVTLPGTTADDLASTEVPFLRMDSVLKELGLDSAQLVAINAGGHEAQVLRGFDLAALDPALVLVASSPGTPADAEIMELLAASALLPFRVGEWLAGLAPNRLSVPLEELLTFFGKGGATSEDSE